MKLKKIFLLILSSFYLLGCIQSASLVGPAITVASTGNLYQAGLSYGSSQIIKHETGKSTGEHIGELFSTEKKNEEKELIDENLIILVKTQIEKTRKKILKNKY